MSTAKHLISRAFLAQSCATRVCRYHSVVPPSEFSEWAKTHRPKLPEYVKGQIHYEYAVEKDAPKIMDFILKSLIPHSPLLECLGSNPQDLADFYEPIVERTLKDQCSLLGLKGDELIALSLHSVKNMSPSYDTPPLNAEILPAKDYSSMIDAARFNTRAARVMHVFMELLGNNIEKLLPDSQKVMFIEVGGVAKSYRGRGISHEMVKHTMQVAHDQFNCDHVVTVADSKAAQKMYYQKLGYKLLRELKFDYFLEGNIPVFHCDEIVSGKLMGKKL